MSVYTGYSQSQYLFDRDWSVLITPQVQSGTDANGNAIYKLSTDGQLFARQQANQVGGATNGAYNNLRVTFDFEKTSEGQSNKGKVEIWNLNATSRAVFQKGAQLTLSAGYVGLMKKIWTADVVSNGVSIERRGSDIVTIFEGGTFERNIEQNIFNKTYPSGTSFSLIIRDLATALGVSLSTIIGISDFNYNRPVIVFGSVKGSLTDLCIDNNLEWHIPNDELLILPKGASFTNQAIVLASGLDAKGNVIENTGLIGIPSQAMEGVVKYTSLLNPDVFPGQLVQIISQTVNGFFVVRKAHYKGDSHGHDWQIECESNAAYDEVNAGQILNNDVQTPSIDAGTVA